ncbi:hypothetical protein G6011_00315 [Alternaria panax]|uniref:Uncharacterized protein n=1 Tax=Alternaria panax TaxID=48097 RepID=A0AAD4IID8_9PLEO|nr:hypothetical protein G6011_00315 [Alternaria panax]
MSLFKNFLAATAIVNVAFASTAYSSDVPSVVTSVQLVTSVTYVDPPTALSSTHCNTLTVTEVAPPGTVTVIAPPPGASTTDVLWTSDSRDVTIQTSIPSSAISKVFGTEPCTHVTSGKDVIAVGCHMPLTSSSNTSKVLPTETCVSSLHTVTHGDQVFTVTACRLPPAGQLPSTTTATLSKTEVIPAPPASATIDTSIVHATANLTGILSSGSTISPPFSHTNAYSHTYPMNGTNTATATGTGGASASASYTAPSLPPFTDAADATDVGAAVLFGSVLMALFGA